MSSDSLLLTNLKGLVIALTDSIFEPDQRRVISILDDIVVKNAVLAGKGDIGTRTYFSFRGGLYNHSSNKTRSNAGSHSLPLHEEMLPKMIIYQSEFAKLTEDYARVRQLIAAQVSGIQSEQTIRNNLPDSVLPLTSNQDLQALSRTTPIEQTHKHKPGSLAEMRFTKTLELIDGYVAMRYIL